MRTRRFLEIDFFRTIALFLMILYHFIYDLDTWTSFPIDVDHVLWFSVGKLSALLFIFLSGVSSGLSHHPVRNGIRVLLWGLVISLVTWIALPDQYVRFGILHFLGTMMILYPLFKKAPNFLLWILVVLFGGLGFFFSEQTTGFIAFLPFGLTYPGFSTIDYYPLFPYSSVTLLGILFYRFRYSNVNQGNSPSHTSFNFFRAPFFQKTSQHSLLIYLIHQPVLLLLILGIQQLIK